MADEQDTDTHDAPAAPRFGYTAPVAWRLAGTAASKNLDLLVTFCVTVGLAVESLEPGAYRVWGPAEAMHKVVEWVETYKPIGPLSFAAEQPPDRLKLKFEVTPHRAPPRLAQIHGKNDVERLVARAIDSGLTVRCVGIGRFKAGGPTRCHILWIQNTFEVDRKRALEILQLTEQSAAAEDAAAPLPAINVMLPTRQTLSEIARDPRTGDITQVRQIERTVT